MKILFRIFVTCLVIPLISVGLCATGGSPGQADKKVRTTVTVTIKDGSSETEGNAGNGPQQFNPNFRNVPQVSGQWPVYQPNARANGSLPLPSSWSPSQSLPLHPHPLKLDIKAIKSPTEISYPQKPNSHLKLKARVHSHHYDPGWFYVPYTTGLFTLFWKVASSFIFVFIGNFLWGQLLKNFGWESPDWELKTSIAKSEDHGQKDKLFGEGGLASQDWQSSYGPHPHLSFDQYVAYPVIQKFSQKAAKKAQKYTKKAQKYAAKSQKYYAKAWLYEQEIEPYKTKY